MSQQETTETLLAEALGEWLNMADDPDTDATDFLAILARKGLTVAPQPKAPLRLTPTQRRKMGNFRP